MSSSFQKTAVFHISYDYEFLSFPSITIRYVHPLLQTMLLFAVHDIQMAENIFFYKLELIAFLHIPQIPLFHGLFIESV